jgi:hypothetical protein
MPSSNRLWKLAGLASVVGVVATGALLARSERERRSYTPDEVRDRLRQRYEAAQGGTGPEAR